MIHQLKSINARLSPKKLFYHPDTLVLGVNNICNLHCKMCDVGTQNLETNFAQNLVGTSPLHMPIDLFQKIVDQTANFFPQTKLGYAFTEPLVYKHLQESLEYANKKKLFTSITTNALTLKRHAEGLIKGGLNELYISLDGPEDIHNEIRGNQKSFQKAIEGIEELLKHSARPSISIFCVITEWNIGFLKKFADFFRNYPIKTIGFMHTNFTPQSVADAHNLLYKSSYPATDSNIDEIDLSNFNFDLLWEEIENIRRTTYPYEIVFSPNIKNKEELLMFYQHPEKLWGKRCNDAFSNIMIKSDGSVIPSHGRCFNLNVGNLYEEDLSAIWNSKIIGDFRAALNKAGGLFPACSRCCSGF